jgi:hypothetical protein
MRTIESFTVMPNGAIELKFDDGSKLAEFPIVLDGEQMTAFIPKAHDQVIPNLLTALSGAIVALSIRLRALEDAHPAINRRVERQVVLTESQQLLASLLRRPVWGEADAVLPENLRLVQLAKLHGVEIPEEQLSEFVGEEEAKRLTSRLSEQANRDQTT